MVYADQLGKVPPTGVDLRKPYLQSPAYNTDFAAFQPAKDYRTSLPHSTAGANWHSVLQTHYGIRLSAYFPGTGVHPSAKYLKGRRSAYFPGSPSVPADFFSTVDIDTVPTSFDWDSATMAAERPTQDQYSNQTLAEALASTQNQINSAHARIGMIDSRIRADYNEAINNTWSAGLNSCDFTSTALFSDVPYVGFSPNWDAGDWYVSALAVGPTGTWTATITCENAPVGDQSCYCDFKGPVADTVDIDP